MSGEKINSGEIVDVSLVDDSGSNSLDPNNHLSSTEHVDDNVGDNESKEIEVEKSHDRLQSSSPPNETSSSANATEPKGKGLKKWRRIKRDILKEPTTNMDPIKMLKRASPNFDSVKQQRSDASVSSTNAIVQTPGDADSFGPSSYGLPVNTTFSAGVDSDNSEDRSSKSSTAVSAPKFRNEALRPLGHPREKHRGKNTGGRNLGSGGPRSQASKAVSVSDPSKKARGGSVNVEKDNSHSSMESDSRSCSSVFFMGKNSVTIDQTESGRPTNDDEDDDDDDEPVSEEHSVEEVRNDCSKYGNNGESENHSHPRECDPLVNSIMMLQSAQAALEKEIHQFGEIGKGIHSFCEDLSENSTIFNGPEVCTGLASDSWNAQMLKRRLGEAEVMLKARDSKIIELIARSTASPLEDVEAELESLFKKKVEAEIEHVALSEINYELSAIVGNQMTLLKEKTSLVKEIEKSSKTVEDVENEAIKLQGHIKEVGALYEESTESEEIQTTRRRVVKLSKYVLVHSVLLLLVLVPFLSQFSPKSQVVVPT